MTNPAPAVIAPMRAEKTAQAIGATGTVLMLLGTSFSKAAQNIGMALALLGVILLLATPGRAQLWQFLKQEPLAWIVGAWILYLVTLSISIHWLAEIKPDNLPQETWRLSRLFLVVLVVFWVARSFTRPMTPVWLILAGYLLGSLMFHHDAGWPFALTSGRLDLWENPQFYGLLSGAVILTLSILAVDLIGRTDSRGFWIRLSLWLITLAMAVNGFLISEARGSMLGLLLSVVVIAVAISLRALRHRRQTGANPRIKLSAILAGVAILIATVVLIGDRTVERFERDLDVVLSTAESPQDLERSSLSVRLVQWDSAIDLWQEKPVFGWGPGSGQLLHEQTEIHDRFHAGGSHFHNTYVDIMLWTGLVGFGLYSSLFIYLFAQGFRAEKWASNRASLLMLSVIVLFLVASFTQTFLTSQVSWFFMASFLGALYGSRPRNQRIAVRGTSASCPQPLTNTGKTH